MMANIREIAKRAGIGIATVSRYFNDSGYVSEESREKIRKAVEELDYTPNALARAIFKKNTKIDTKVKPIVMAKVKKPPTLLTAAILSTPLAAKNVTTTKNTTSKIPKSCVDVKFNKCQL